MIYSSFESHLLNKFRIRIRFQSPDPDLAQDPNLKTWPTKNGLKVFIKKEDEVMLKAFLRNMVYV
jgi:hypothetical protein